MAVIDRFLAGSLFEHRNRSFWVLQIGGWAGYALVNYIGSLMHEMRDIYTIVLLLGAYAGFLLTIPLRYLYQRIWELHPIWLMLVVISTSYVCASVWAVIDNATYWEIYKFGFRPDSSFFYFKNNLAKFYIILSWSGLYFGIKYYQMLQSERQKALLASSRAHQAQLKMLRYQLNPHFLFNSLNAISTLIMVKENDVANKMVNRLSHFLRFSLDNDPIKKITLQKEVDALMLYLDIEKVRFDERLDIQVELSDEAKVALVPSLLLQPLIENAIKYAMAKVEPVGVLQLQAWQHQNELLIRLCDNGPEAPEHPELLLKNSGVGLQNTRDRLHALYGKRFNLTMKRNQPQGLCVEIKLPYETLENP
ncbi:MAG: sensor histidine kinase [Idiomarinaceae bacterium]|nr:sensor histidine kinase [Idiomarinaceae bacterium]